jgi:hypothetical protein
VCLRRGDGGECAAGLSWRLESAEMRRVKAAKGPRRPEAHEPDKGPKEQNSTFPLQGTHSTNQPAKARTVSTDSTGNATHQIARLVTIQANRLEIGVVQGWIKPRRTARFSKGGAGQSFARHGSISARAAQRTPPKLAGEDAHATTSSHASSLLPHQRHHYFDEALGATAGVHRLPSARIPDVIRGGGQIG